MPKKTLEEKNGFIKTRILQSDTIFQDLGDWYQRLYASLYRGYVNSSLFKDCPSDVGLYTDIHDTKISDGLGTYDYKRKTLGLPLIAAQHLKTLVFGKGVEVKFNGDEKQTWFDEFFKYNKFFKNEKDLFEMQVAVGDKVESFYKSGEKVLLNYIPSHRFIVTEFDNAGVRGGIFVSYRKVTIDKKPKWLTLLELHSVVKNKVTASDPPIFTNNYVIRREIYQSDNQYHIDRYLNFDKYIHYFGTLQEVETEENMDMPLFEFSKNPINNSKAPLSKKGQSIFGGKLDQLQVLATVYDGMYFEYLLKQFMVVAPEEAIEEFKNTNGDTTSKYNPRAGVLFSRGRVGEYQSEWQSFSPDIRDQSFISGMNMNLDIAAVGMGFSAGTFRFDGKSIQTATQVKAEKNETFNTVEEYENNLAESWVSLFIKVATYAKKWGLITWDLVEKDITINFDKSDMIDKQEQFTNDISSVNGRIMPKQVFRERHYKLDETEEKRWAELLEKEQSSVFDFGDNDNDEDESEVDDD